MYNLKKTENKKCIKLIQSTVVQVTVKIKTNTRNNR